MTLTSPLTKEELEALGFEVTLASAHHETYDIGIPSSFRIDPFEGLSRIDSQDALGYFHRHPSQFPSLWDIINNAVAYSNNRAMADFKEKLNQTISSL